MGYFAARAAPMGPVSADVVQAAFYNFHPAMVRRAIPDAWTHAAPAAILAARSHAAADAIRRLAPHTDATCSELHPLLMKAIEHGNGKDRPLFTANRNVEPAGDLLADVWQAATTLHEHRGDGHVELLAESEIDGCEAHVLFAATESVAAETFATTAAGHTRIGMPPQVGCGVASSSDRPDSRPTPDARSTHTSNCAPTSSRRNRTKRSLNKKWAVSSLAGDRRSRSHHQALSRSPTPWGCPPT